MIKLAIFTPEFCYPSETFIIDSTRLDPKHFEVSIVTFKLTDFAKKNLPKKIKVHVITESKLDEMLSTFDMIHVHYLNNLRLLSLNTIKNNYVYVTCHGEDVFKYGRDFFYRLQLKDKVKAVAQFLPVSQNLALDLKQKFKIKPYQVRVMPLGIDLKKYLFKPKTKLSNPLKLGVAARLVEYKGVDDLLKAGQLLKSSGQKFEIHIVGSGPDEKKLKKLAHQLGVSKNTFWHGWLSGKSLISKLRTFDIYVAPYKTARDGAKDSMTMILKEVMALGIPVISTTNSAIPELITHEKHGLLVSENNPQALAAEIENLMQNKKMRQKIVSEGRKRIQKDFNLKNQTQQWLLLKLFQNL